MAEHGKHRMYVDEVGNSDLGSSDDPNHRYLSLTGVILRLKYVHEVLFPRLEDLKSRYFDSHPDEPVILHRRELVARKHPFQALRNPERAAEFDGELFALIRDLDYRLLTIVIDKKEHRERYAVWHADPYHYCMQVLVERYVMFLERQDAVGDVLAESRGGNEDRRLKDSFERTTTEGTNFLENSLVQARLTSRQLKVKSKASNIAGLQLADLLASPAFRLALARRRQEPLRPDFGAKISDIIERLKWERDPTGKLEGWGLKWLP